jgi:hypothetical protein
MRTRAITAPPRAHLCRRRSGGAFRSRNGISSARAGSGGCRPGLSQWHRETPVRRHAGRARRRGDTECASPWREGGSRVLCLCPFPFSSVIFLSIFPCVAFLGWVEAKQSSCREHRETWAAVAVGGKRRQLDCFELVRKTMPWHYGCMAVMDR